MADLPSNTTYSSGPTSESISNIRKTLKRNPAMTVSKPSSSLASQQYSKLNSMMPNVPTGQPLAEQKRVESIPEGYGTFDERFGQPSDSAHIINFGGGQLVSDPTQPRTLIRTKRPEYDPALWAAENSAALGNRASNLYQVDHIVPLWAGGADTVANKTVLTWDEHNRKTNAQSVPLTLLSRGKITAKEAQLLAVSWKDRDLTDVPERDNYGMIPLEKAEEVYRVWKEQDKKGTWIKDNKPMTGWNYIKETFKPSSLKESVKNVGDYMVPDFVPGNEKIEAFGQGFASGFTGGWIPGVSPEATTSEKLLGMAGTFAGMLLPVGRFAKFFGVESKIANTAGVKALSEIGINASSKAASNIAGETIYRKALEVAKKSGSEIFKKATSDNAIAYAKAFATYGQLSREGLLGKGAEMTGLAEEGQARPIGRFVEDVVYGVTTGVFKPGLKGAVGMASTPLFLSAMMQPFNNEFDEDWMSEALIMSAVMGGLHMVSGLPDFANAPGTKNAKRWLGEYKGSGETMRAELATKTFEDIFPSSPITKSLRNSEGKTQNFQSEVYSQENIDSLVDEAIKRIIRYATSGEKEGAFKPSELSGATLEEVQKEIMRVKFAGRELYKRGLPEEQRILEDGKDFVSILERRKKYEDVLGAKSIWDEIPDTFATSGKAKKALEFIDDVGLRDSISKNSPVADSGENLTGTLRLTGISSDVNSLNNKNVITYLDALVGNNPDKAASRTVIFVDRSETSPMWEKLSKMYEENITNNKVNLERNEKPFQNPDKAIEVYGIIYDKKTGEKQLVSLGWVPRESRIDGDYKYAFNKQPEVLSDPERFPPLDSTKNKDTLSVAMREKNLPVLFGEIDASRSGKAAQKSGEPFIHVKIKDAHWDYTNQRLMNQIPRAVPIGPVSPISTGIKDIRSKLENKKKVSKVVKTTNILNKRISQPVDEVILASFGGQRQSAELTYLRSFVNAVRKAIEFPKTTPELQASLNKLGIELNKKQAAQLMAKRDTITFEETINLLTELNNAGQTTNHFSNFFIDGVREALESKEFRSIAIKNGFNIWDLPLLGGIKKSAEIGPKMLHKAPEKTEMAPSTTIENKTATEAPRASQSTPQATITQVEQPKVDIASKIVGKAQATPGFSKKVDPTTGQVTIERPRELPSNERISNSFTVNKEVTSNEKAASGETRKSYINKAIVDTVEAAKQRMAELKVSEAGGEEAQISAFTSIIKNIKPEVSQSGAPRISKDFGGISKLSMEEQQFVTKEAQRELSSVAGEILNLEKVASKELFDIGITTANEFYDVAHSMKVAEKLQSLGNSSPLRDLKSTVGKEVFDLVKDLIKNENYQVGGKNISFSEVAEKISMEGLSEARKAASEKNIREFFEEPLKFPEDDYMHVFARTLNSLLESSSLGKDWKNNPIIATMFSSLKNKKDSTGRTFTFFDNLMNSGLSGKTQPLGYAEEMAKGNIGEAAKLREKRVAELEDAQSFREIQPTSNELAKEKIDIEDFTSGMKVETPTQRPDTNIDITTPMDSIMFGITVAARKGTKPTPQFAISDSTRFMNEIVKNYKEIYNKMLKRQQSKAKADGRKVPEKPSYPIFKDSGYLGSPENLEFMKIPEMKYDYNIASKIKKEIIDSLSSKKIPLGEKRENLILEAAEANKKVDIYSKELETVVSSSLLPQYKYLNKHRGVPNFKKFTEGGKDKITPEKIKHLGTVLVAKERSGAYLDRAEKRYLFDFQKAQGLARLVEENKFAKDIALADRKSLYGTLK